MRTVLLTMVLLGLAVATGASFVVRAQDAPAATLEASCEPSERPARADVLVTCTLVATNSGGETINDAAIGFEPAQNLDIPDRYYFWSARLDGVAFEIGSTNLSFALGDLPAGVRRVLEVEVIVRATRTSGADAVLFASNGSRELARRTLAADVSAPKPQEAAISFDLRPVGGAPGYFDARLRVAPGPGSQITKILADVGLDDGFTLSQGETPRFDADPAVTPGKKSLTTILIEPYMPPDDAETINFQVRAPGACTGGTVAVVAHIESNGSVLRPAALGFIEYDDTCFGAALPAGGSAPPPRATGALDALAALGVAGAALTLGGWLLRRATPRRRT